MKEPHISMSVVRRLPRYYRFLCELVDDGAAHISSKELASRMGLTASQVRQDLNCFGGFGQQGYGYPTATLRQEIGTILGLDACRPTILLGAGNIGRGLANHMDFSRYGLKLCAVLDSDPALAGHSAQRAADPLDRRAGNGMQGAACGACRALSPQGGGARAGHAAACLRCARILELQPLRHCPPPPRRHIGKRASGRQSDDSVLSDAASLRSTRITRSSPAAASLS